VYRVLEAIVFRLCHVNLYILLLLQVQGHISLLAFDVVAQYSKLNTNQLLIVYINTVQLYHCVNQRTFTHAGTYPTWHD